MALWEAGDGGYGRLGHSVQQDEFRPRKIETFGGRMPLAEESIVSPKVSSNPISNGSDMTGLQLLTQFFTCAATPVGLLIVMDTEQKLVDDGLGALL